MAEIDRRADRAWYRQIADRLRRDIETSVIAPGGQLPSESQLMAEYEVSRVTVRRAFGMLMMDGLVEPEHGRGWFARVDLREVSVGPDLPPPNQPITLDVLARRWPTGAEKVELVDGCPYFYGSFDQRDVEAAERAYPGRHAVILPWDDEGRFGNLIVVPSDQATIARLASKSETYRLALQAIAISGSDGHH